MEKSICLLDDASRREKSLMIEMLKTEDKVSGYIPCPNNGAEMIKPNEIFKSISCVCKTLKKKLFETKEPRISVHDAINILVSMQQQLSVASSNKNGDISVEESSSDLVIQAKDEMDNLKSCLTDDDRSILLAGDTIREGMCLMFLA